MTIEELTGENIDGPKTPSGHLEVDTNFARWARSQLSTKDISRISLRLQDSNAQGTIVETWERAQLKIGPEEIITAIYTAAEMDARQFSGMQTYFVFFYVEDGKEGSVFRSSFRIQGGQAKSEDLMSMEGSEAPTGKGLVSQLMRHNEATMRVALMGAQAAQSTLTGIIREMAGRLERVESREMKVMELHERLQDKTLERDIKRDNSKALREVATELGNKLLPMVGQVMGQKLMGGMMPPPPPPPPSVAAASPEEPQQPSQEAQVLAFIQTLVVSFTHEQILNMAGAMDEKQREGFMQVYQFFKMHEAEAAKIASQNQAPEVTVKPTEPEPTNEG